MVKNPLMVSCIKPRNPAAVPVISGCRFNPVISGCRFKLEDKMNGSLIPRPNEKRRIGTITRETVIVPSR